MLCAMAESRFSGQVAGRPWIVYCSHGNFHDRRGGAPIAVRRGPSRACRLGGAECPRVQPATRHDGGDAECAADFDEIARETRLLVGARELITR